MSYWGSRVAGTNNLLRFLVLIVVGVGSIIMIMFWRSELFSTIDVTASTSQLPILRGTDHHSAIKNQTDLLKAQLDGNSNH